MRRETRMKMPILLLRGLTRRKRRTKTRTRTRSKTQMLSFKGVAKKEDMKEDMHLPVLYFFGR